MGGAVAARFAAPDIVVGPIVLMLGTPPCVYLHQYSTCRAGHSSTVN